MKKLAKKIFLNQIKETGSVVKIKLKRQNLRRIKREIFSKNKSSPMVGNQALAVSEKLRITPILNMEMG